MLFIDSGISVLGDFQGVLVEGLDLDKKTGNKGKGTGERGDE